jgi:hypothetical protein
MAAITGKIAGLYTANEEDCFRLHITDINPPGCAVRFCWSFRNGSARPLHPYPVAKNYDTLLSMALWCATNGVRVKITTAFDINALRDVSIDEFEADF